jgi:hypothetical protein
MFIYLMLLTVFTQIVIFSFKTNLKNINFFKEFEVGYREKWTYWLLQMANTIQAKLLVLNKIKE